MVKTKRSILSVLYSPVSHCVLSDQPLRHRSMRPPSFQSVTCSVAAPIASARVYAVTGEGPNAAAKHLLRVPPTCSKCVVIVMGSDCVKQFCQACDLGAGYHKIVRI